MIKKAVLSNRIFMNADQELQDRVDACLTYKVPAKRMGDPPQIIKQMSRIKGDMISIPIGAQWLIPEDYEIVDKRVEVSAEFPEFKYTLRPDQKDIYDQVTGSCLINANPAWGKAQPLYSKIRVPGGWTTMGEIAVGDTIKTPSNGTAKVVAKYEHTQKDIYRLSLSDGRSVDACDEHLWSVIKHTGYKQQVINTKGIIEALEKGHRVYLPLPSIIDDAPRSHIIDPYLLGFLLGDGSISTRSISFSSADEFIVEKVQSLLPEGHNVVYSSQYDYYITADGKTNLVTQELRRLNLLGSRSHTKFIPEEYLNDCIDNKLRLLQGLFDADGDVETKGYIAYCTGSEQLMADVVSIINSLGGTAQIQSRFPNYTYKGEKRAGKISYRVRPSKLPLEIKMQLFSLPRKVERIKANKLDNTQKVTIKEAKYVGKMDCACIALDSEDKLYLTDHYIMTHNTFTGLAIAGKLKQKTLIVCHTVALRTQWEKEVQKVYGFTPGIIGSGKFDTEPSIVVANIQTLYNFLPEIANKFGAVILDECHHVSARTFSSIIDKSTAKYKIGLSATLERKDGRHVVFRDYFSTDVKVAEDNNSMTPEVIIFNSELHFPDGAGIPWANKVTEVARNPDYQHLICILAEKYRQMGHKVLVLSDRVQLLNTCHNMLEDRSEVITGEVTRQEDREKRLNRITQKGIGILFGSLSIFSEGISQNHLSCLILGTPINNDPLLHQVIGRVTRVVEGKPTPLIIDINLKGNTAKNQAMKRKGFYMKKGWKITEVDFTNL